MSRPTKYRDEFANTALKLCHLGMTDRQVAFILDVDERTINRWKKQHPEYCQSLKKGKLPADMQVVNALYHRATGWKQPEDILRVVKGKVVRTPVIRH